MNEKEIYSKILDWLKDKKDVAIASVIETWGSSPRPVGSIMAINNNNEIVGSVSGGCVESFVFSKALEVIKSNKVETLEFGVTNTKAWEVGLTCGGKIKVFLEKISYSDLNYIKRINSSFTKNENILVATRLKDGKRKILNDTENLSLKNSFNINTEKVKSGLEILSNEIWYLKIFENNIKVIIIGAVHIAEPLIKFLNNLAYEVFLIDPRSSFNEKRYSNVKILKEWPDEALKKIKIDKSTAIVTLTHDPKLDDPALLYSLKTKAFYIGCLGSSKTHKSRILRLKKKDINQIKLSRLNGPVGIDIGAKTPTEIAVSIISQIIKKKNTGNA
ncbi:MAG: hypothetical protein CMJ06_06035 [Pelagibacterales bacterium]|nr:hypothetical protein [Pelagibacterales bacterium]OUU61194.1 MAG: hypothetical protein CBC22_08180 [Alphaproteobacteria bacterium TMED62]|tara:strand:- start:8105 stop:9097 length:993 start_codon:yes stop_codon:yes gene_type:complete